MFCSPLYSQLPRLPVAPVLDCKHSIILPLSLSFRSSWLWDLLWPYNVGRSYMTLVVRQDFKSPYILLLFLLDPEKCPCELTQAGLLESERYKAWLVSSSQLTTSQPPEV